MGRVPEVQLLARGDAAQVQETEQAQGKQEGRADERGNRAHQSDLTHLPERIGVQQKPAQGLAPEDGLHLTGQLGVGGVGQRLAAELGVRLTARHLVEMNRDEVVGIRPVMCVMGQLLPGLIAELGFFRGVVL